MSDKETELFKGLYHGACEQFDDDIVSVHDSQSIEIDCTGHDAPLTYPVRQYFEDRGYETGSKRDGRFKNGLNPDRVIVSIPDELHKVTDNE